MQQISGSRVVNMTLRDKVIQDFRQHYRYDPQLVVRAPGRVNLLGAHVDYNEGWVLPAATEQAVWLAASPSTGQMVNIKAVDFEGQDAGFSLDDLTARDGERVLTWLDYPRGAAWTLQSNGYHVTPMDVVFAGDVPIGAGVSSSAAVEVAFLTAWNWLGKLQLDPVELAKLGQQVENRYIGLASGIMDQFASVHGSEDHLVLLDCRSLEHALVPLPPDCAILVADTGIRRALASTEYNVRRSQCEEAVAILKESLPEIHTLRDVTPHEFEMNAHRLPLLLRRRAQHVVEECRRVLEGAELLRQGDVASFGGLLRDSHASARDLYEVSIPELDLLAATAWQVDGCYGARLTGAGFGGCIVVLASAEATERIVSALRQAYQASVGRVPRIFETRAAEGASVLKP